MSKKTGAPLKFETPEELQKKIDEYFDIKCAPTPILDSEGKQVYLKNGSPSLKYNPPTVAGLALYLGFSDRRSIYDYKDREIFSHTVKAAITRIEEYAEQQLSIGQATGAIFWLKNHGWVDKSETELSGKDGKDLTVSLVKFE